MKTTDSVMRELQKLLDNYFECSGYTCPHEDGGKHYVIGDEDFKDILSHSLAEARREVDENWNKRLLKLEDKVFYTSTSKEALQAVKDMRASLTGDNPERK